MLKTCGKDGGNRAVSMYRKIRTGKNAKKIAELLDLWGVFDYNQTWCLLAKIEINVLIFIYISFQIKEVESNENDISAKETFQSESSWIQSKNEHGRRKKKFWQPEEQKEEKYYQRRPHICGLFFYANEDKAVICVL